MAPDRPQLLFMAAPAVAPALRGHERPAGAWQPLPRSAPLCAQGPHLEAAERGGELQPAAGAHPPRRHHRQWRRPGTRAAPVRQCRWATGLQSCLCAPSPGHFSLSAGSSGLPLQAARLMMLPRRRRRTRCWPAILRALTLPRPGRRRQPWRRLRPGRMQSSGRRPPARPARRERVPAAAVAAARRASAGCRRRSPLRASRRSCPRQAPRLAAPRAQPLAQRSWDSASRCPRWQPWHSAAPPCARWW